MKAEGEADPKVIWTLTFPLGAALEMPMLNQGPRLFFMARVVVSEDMILEFSLNSKPLHMYKKS